MSSNVTVVGRVGPEGPGLLVLYTGGTIGMIAAPNGALVPLDLRELTAYVPIVPDRARASDRADDSHPD